MCIRDSVYTVGVKVRLFSKDANPLGDRPLLHKSRAYVDGLILSGEAVYLEGGRSAQLLGWHSRTDDVHPMLRGGLGDWAISDYSVLPGRQILRITTRQRVS